jgi:RND family efflux transporter MFP subunit
MKRLWIVVVALMVVGALAAGGYAATRAFRGGGESKVEPTELVARKSRFVRSAVARGLVKPKVGAQVKVGSQVSGIVRRMLVGVGEEVRKGQLLAELDDSRIRAELAAARQRLAAAKTEWDLSRSALDRLLRIESVSRSTISQQTIDDQRERVRINEAAFQRIRAEVDQIEVTLSYTRITAPIDGTIVEISTNEGETVAASFAAPTFVTIINLDRQEIRAYVDEADIGSIRGGQDVDFRLESFPGRDLRGKVRTINPKPEVSNNVVSYIVLVDFEQPEGILIRPEMSAQVDFVLEARDDAVVVSSKSLIRDDGIDYVAVKRDGRWRKQQVKTGMRDAGKIEILDGLKAGDIYLEDKNDWNRLAQQQ